MNKGRLVIKYLGILLLLIVLAAIIAMQLPSVQTRLTGAVIERVKDKVNGRISLGAVHFKLFNTILLQDIVIVDTASVCKDVSDTLLSLNALSVRFSFASLLGHKDIRVKSIRLRDGQFNLVLEEMIGDGPDKQTNFKRIFNIVSKDQEKPFPENDILQIRNIFAKGITFRLRNIINEPVAKPRSTVDFSFLELNDIYLHASKLKIGGGYLTVNMDRLSAREKSGWDVKKIDCSLKIGHRTVSFIDMNYDDGFSKLNLDLSLLGRVWCYKTFAKEVGLIGDIHHGALCFETISHFVPGMKPDENSFLSLEGQIDGYIKNLNFDHLHIGCNNGRLATDITGNINSLTPAPSFGIKLENTLFSTAEIQKTALKFAPKLKMDLTKFGRGQIYNMDLSVNGTMKNLEITTLIHQGRNNGSLSADLNIRNLGSKSERIPMLVGGKIIVKDLDLYALAGLEKMGAVSISSGIAASIPTDISKLEARLDSLNIQSVCWNGCVFKDIQGNVQVQGKDITADLHSRGEIVKADLTIWTDSDTYNIISAIQNADLSGMHLDERPGTSAGVNLSGHVNKDFSQLSGKVSLSDLRMTTMEGTSFVDNMTVTLEQSDDIFDISLNSSVADGTFSGNKKAFNTDLTLYSINPILSFFKNGIYVEKGSRISGQMGLDGKIAASISSGRIALDDKFIKNFKIDVAGTLDSLGAKILADNINFQDNSMNNNVLEISKVGNVIDLKYIFDNCNTDLWAGNLNSRITLKQNKDMDIAIFPSTLKTVDNLWTISESSICKKGKRVEIDSFSIRSKEQWFNLNGSLDKEAPAVLYADIHNFDVEPWNRFIKKDLDLKGKLTAKGKIYSPMVKGIPESEMTMTVESFNMCGTNLGNLKIASKFNKSEDIMTAIVSDNINGKNAILADVSFKPTKKNIEASISLDRLPIGFAQPFVPTLFSRVDGKMSGLINVSGPLDKLDFSSKNCRIDDGGLEVAFTKVYYDLNGTFHIDNNGITMEKVDIKDRFGADGIIQNGVLWERGKNMAMNFDILFKDMEVLNTTPATTSAKFYGGVFATGSASLKGKFGATTLSAEAATKGTSSMHFVLSKDSDVSRSNLLTFIDPYQKVLDPYDEILEKYKKKEEKKKTFKFILHAVVDPSLSIFIDMGSGGFAAGMEGRGSGDVDLNVTRDQGFKILGDYNIQEGSFGVNASNLVKRDFSIKNGSSIKFGGDLFNSDLDLKATYETEASISALIADTTSVSNRRQVLCGLDIKNKLNNPSLDFSIEIPDLDPSHKSAVESALSTEDKVQRQFLSLLLTNNFIPDEQSGIVNSSSLLYSNVSDIMANQVNNIFNRLNIPLDLGLNYQPSTNGKSMFDVALSTQLFNNRVIIGGTLGNRPDNNSNSQTVFGDVDIQYKVNRTGTLRVKAFSHSADQYSNYLDNSQRNGLGVTWQQEFNHFVPWIVNLFKKKSVKEENALKEYQKSKETQTLVIYE